jgi:ABC-type Fe3+/spermidine/putrescine transport system ATPase subunit
MTMGDRVAVLKNGVLQRVETPAWSPAKPANVFVAGTGDFRTVDAEAGGGGPAVLTAHVPGDSAIGVGEPIMLRLHHDRLHVFSPTTGERLD